ncbi:RNA polymerase II, partial [Ramicandelaber brevisporus]
LQRNRAAKRITETEDAAMLKLGEEFDKAECLMLSEVKLLLEADRETKIKKSGEASLNEIFQKTLAYAQRFSTLKNEDTIKEVRSLLVEAEVFKPFENAQLANLGCQDSDEAFALIPSLANKISGEDLQHYLNEIQNFTKFQG